ncbi:MlaE family lipid ABC transporter permease subunit [bacterium]|nr:MlaE family lipid ABC transporter permease subunit [bacterium]
MLNLVSNDDFIAFEGELTFTEIKKCFEFFTNLLKEKVKGSLVFDFAKLEKIDSSGVACIDEIQSLAQAKQVKIKIINSKDEVLKIIQTFTFTQKTTEITTEKTTIFEALGENFLVFWQSLKDLLYLVSDIFYWSIVGVFDKKGQRKGSFIQQSILIGVNSLPILSLISLLIGLILSLQSAEQLRQFGANIYVADLIAISMTREMGPLITAIILAGRSGSAIASEIATMTVTEEIDALKTMAISPIRYIFVPKFHAITVIMPLLSVLSVVIGIIGGFIVGYFYLDLSFNAYFSETLKVLMVKDFLTGFTKSIVFAWIIVIVGCFFGISVKGGAEGVGKVTTSSVVASIFTVILADSFFSLIFYF